MSADPERPAAESRPKVVVTAGPTREYLDDVRFLSNASTGRMGYEIAREAHQRGAEVTLILGPSHLDDLAGVETVRVVSTDDLRAAARAAAKGADLMIFAAAPSDYRPIRRRRGKPPREGGDLELVLRPTPDVARTLGHQKGRRVHVGFALEVASGEHRARVKIARKNFDAIVLNGLENFGTGGGEITWIPREGSTESLTSTSKQATAEAIVSRCFDLLRERASA